MGEKDFKAELERFARWFDKKDHGNDSYTKIVDRYVKENMENISESVHFCSSPLCECKTDLDRSQF